MNSENSEQSKPVPLDCALGGNRPDHAIMVLEEERCRIRALIRTIGRNMHEIMSPIDYQQEQRELDDIEAALLKLSAH